MYLYLFIAVVLSIPLLVIIDLCLGDDKPHATVQFTPEQRTRLIEMKQKYAETEELQR